LTASLPHIILLSHDLQELQNCGSKSGVGEAHLIDVEGGSPEVVHLSPLAKPGATRGRQVLPLKWHLNGGQMPESATARVDPEAMVWIDTNATPAVARCNLHLDDAWVLEHPVDIIQTGSVAFTRNAPIL